ncbi:sigma-70 family RNA polymerase sigma factor, partial [candidate division WOR-3 bacterium]|nr:sigma-70 family RNA polymerase sigma factor [candidate division WOR-3 bacterium]
MMDRELVARILREEGYEEGCRELVTRYQPQLFNDCYRWTGNRRDALDLTQDAWARAFQLLDRWNPDRCCFHTWLYAIAHALLEHRRRKAARGHRAEQEHACRLLVRDEICPDPGTIAESRVLISQLLEPCTPVERSCLMLRHMDDRTAPDIARLLG